MSAWWVPETLVTVAEKEGEGFFAWLILHCQRERVRGSRKQPETSTKYSIVCAVLDPASTSA